jgi:hypothetical protein
MKGIELMMDTVTLEQAIQHLYQTAVLEKTRTSTLRLQMLAQYCLQQLSQRGLSGAKTEVTIPGGGRPKQWDVAWNLHEKCRLALSLKSILRNLSGTVPNRIDDLIGEVANVQMYSPEIVVGYLIVFDTSKDVFSVKHQSTWCDLLRARLGRLAKRKAPFWSVGMVEAFEVIEVDFSSSPRLVTQPASVERFFDVLAAETRRRNPFLDSEDELR